MDNLYKKLITFGGYVLILFVLNGIFEPTIRINHQVNINHDGSIYHYGQKGSRLEIEHHTDHIFVN
jgi:hypothetical protein